MEELYLILHKVRGQAALDVATRVHLSGGKRFGSSPLRGIGPIHSTSKPSILRSGVAPIISKETIGTCCPIITLALSLAPRW